MCRCLLPSRSCLFSPPLHALTLPVNPAHSTPHWRLRPRRLQGALRTLATPVRLRRRNRNPRTFPPPLPALRHTARRPSFPPSGSKPSLLPTSSTTHARRRQRSDSSPTQAASTRLTAPPSEGRLLPISLSAGWSAFKEAQKSTWLVGSYPEASRLYGTATHLQTGDRCWPPCHRQIFPWPFLLLLPLAAHLTSIDLAVPTMHKRMQFGISTGEGIVQMRQS